MDVKDGVHGSSQGFLLWWHFLLRDIEEWTCVSLGIANKVSYASCYTYHDIPFLHTQENGIEMLWKLPKLTNLKSPELRSSEHVIFAYSALLLSNILSTTEEIHFSILTIFMVKYLCLWPRKLSKVHVKAFGLRTISNVISKICPHCLFSLGTQRQSLTSSKMKEEISHRLVIE